MPPELLRWYTRLGLTIAEGYGMTENCAVSHATFPDAPRPGTVGKPYDGIESRIDPATGEVQMRAPCVMLGYYKEPELTRQAFTEDGWLRTGDKGEPDSEGNLRITGRIKDLFKTSKGKYVAPAPIENALIVHDDVEQALVRADFELLARLLVDVRRAVDGETLDERRKRDGSPHGCAGALGRIDDLAGGMIQHAMIEGLEPDADVLTIHIALFVPYRRRTVRVISTISKTNPNSLVRARTR